MLLQLVTSSNKKACCDWIVKDLLCCVLLGKTTLSMISWIYRTIYCHKCPLIIICEVWGVRCEVTCLDTFPLLSLSIFLNSFSIWDSSPRNSSKERKPSKSLSLVRKKSSTSSLEHKMFTLRWNKSIVLLFFVPLPLTVMSKN